MTTKITITDLVEALRKAAASPEAHSDAQLRYFSKIKENSVLTSHNTACCIAGYLMLKAHEGASEDKIEGIITNCLYPINMADWLKDELGLTEAEDILAFHPHTHHEVHALLADLLESGFRLPEDDEVLNFSLDSTYAEFDYAYLGADDANYMSLDELKAWMRAIAK